ncbi:hypothetical protein EU244_027640 [Rhodococcus qingshengii]|nr:hypothetical protein [Rhodococcus qingshengii]
MTARCTAKPVLNSLHQSPTGGRDLDQFGAAPTLFETFDQPVRQ